MSPASTKDLGLSECSPPQGAGLLPVEPDARHPTSKYVYSGVVVSIENETAVRTIVNTDGQVLWDNFTASRTILRSSPRINSRRQPTSVLSFIGREVYELTPCSIGNTLVYAAPIAVLHILDIQVLKGDDLILINQSPAQLVSKIVAATGNAMMNMLDNSLAFAIFRRAFLAFTQTALGFRKRLFILAEKARIGNVLSARQRSKMTQAHINTDHLVAGRQQLRFNNTREAGVPVTQDITPDSQRFDLAFDGSVDFDPDLADFGKVKPTIVRKIETTLRICKRFVPITFEARIARFFSCFHAAKEVLKSQIDTGAGFLQTLRVCITEKRMLCLPAW